MLGNEKTLDVSANTQQSISLSHQDSESLTRARGRGLRLLRWIYGILFMTLLSIFVMGIPAQLNKLASGVIGIAIRQNDSCEFILSPIPGQPAGDAGIQEGDVLIAIDGSQLQPGMETRRLLQLLRRPPRAQIRLDVRKNEGPIHSYTITLAGFPLERFGLSTKAYANYLITLGIALVLGFCIPALIIFFRKSDDWLAMFVSLTLVMIAIYNSAAYADLSFLPLSISTTIEFLYSLSVLIILYIFPDGRFVPRWTSSFTIIGVFWISWKILPLSFVPSLWTSGLWIIIEVMCFGTGIYAQIYRYHKVSDLQARQQTKWITFGITVAYLIQYAYYLPLTFLPTINAPTALGLGYSVFGRTLHHLVMLVLPITVTHAVLRRRLYDIDIIINRTLVYVPLSAIVAGTFTAVITLSQMAFVALTGETSDIAIVLTTLLVASMVAPIKEHLQSWVNKRFKEVAYPESVLDAFKKQIQTRLTTVDPGPVTRRFLEEAVRAFEADSGVAYLWRKSGLKKICAIGEWHGEEKINVPIEIDGKRLASIALSAKEKGRDYTAQDVQALHQVAQVVAQAIEQDRKSQTR